MIIGLIPVGGKGVRLGLPYAKEMLPQKNYDHFNPVINHLVEKMELAGAKQIVFVHGLEYKQDIVEFYHDELWVNHSKYVHITQDKLGFANVISAFFDNVDTHDGDKVIFGLPDSVFNVNPFVEMINEKGIVAGLFTTEPFSKVDRLSNGKFQVKSAKNDSNEDWFWGVLKFDIDDIAKMYEDNIFDKYTEIGDIVNHYGFKTVKGDKYLDLGTWAGYNKYLTSNDLAGNIEIEKKYDASNIKIHQFTNFFINLVPKEITSTDYYFKNNNEAIEFIRYREDSNDEGAIPDITIKNKGESTTNRFELTVPLSKDVTTHNVLHLMSLLEAEYEFKVTKVCWIYEFNDYTIVYYTFDVGDKQFKVIEVELKKADFNLLTDVENRLSEIPGFNPNNIINKSKYQMVKEVHDNSTH